MPILVATYLLQFACAAHALRRGASYPVIFLIVAFPFLGCAVYVFAVILPEFLGSKTARDAAESVKDTVAPQRHLERYADNLEIADTVEKQVEAG